MSVSTGPLAGVQFLTGAASPGEVLPRMDVAYLVGMARKGPVDEPVAVEGLAEFEGIFGGETLLAWDQVGGDFLRAQLRTTIRQFFANGGRRCWVTRVLDIDSARKGHFALPSLLSVGTGSGISVSPVAATARWFGSWSDDIKVSVRADRLRLRCTAPATRAAKRTVEVATPIVDGIRPGDAVRVALGPTTHFLLPVVSVDPSAGPDRSSKVVTMGRGVAARRVDPSVPHVSGDSCRVSLFDQADGADWTESRATASCAWLPEGLLEVKTLSVDPALRPVPGSVGRVRWTKGPSCWMKVVECQASRAGLSDGRIEVRILAEVWELGLSHLEDDLDRELAACRYLERIRMDLRVSDDAGDAIVRGLPLADASGWNLGDRYPLAAPDLPDLVFPLGDLLEFGEGCGPLPDPAPALERDGLGTFDETAMRKLFLDPLLESLPVGALMDAAEHQAHFPQVVRMSLPAAPSSRDRAVLAEWRARRDRWLHRLDRGEREVQPRGIHALLAGTDPGPSTEATLVAVPDSVHPLWSYSKPDRSWWVRTPPGPDPTRESGSFHDCREDKLPAPGFEMGDPPDSEGRIELVWSVSDPLEPTDPDHPILYELQESVDPSREAWETVYTGAQARHVRRITRHLPRSYRVRLRKDEVDGPWSEVVRITMVPVPFQVAAATDTEPPPEEAGLLDFHRSLLRVAGARGDSLAILGLPRSWNWTQAAHHADALRDPSHPGSAIDPITAGEPRVLSQGILAHPWIFNLDDPRVATCAVGSIAGLLSATASTSGAWISPGKARFLQSVGIDQVARAPDLVAADSAQLCAVGSDPRGVSVNFWYTLSKDRDERVPSVRRFMGLLRRLCLRRGATWVFEPAGPELVGAVERGMARLLESLRLRGALRGSGEGSSFRVDVVADPDSGSLKVDLRVAPSVPMSWLYIRLDSIGERLLAEEVPST